MLDAALVSEQLREASRKNPLWASRQARSDVYVEKREPLDAIRRIVHEVAARRRDGGLLGAAGA